MFDIQQHPNSDPILTSPISPEEWRELSRPTIVCVLVTPRGELLLVQPKKAAPNGWIFPQGAIERQESLLDAALREAHEELGYSPQMLGVDKAKFIGKARFPTGGTTGKEYFVAAVPLINWMKPVLNSENSKVCTVGGPGELIQKVADCSRNKKRLIRRVLITAIADGVLFSQRWTTTKVNQFFGAP